MALFLIAVPAHADSICASPAAVKSASTSCESNKNFADAAAACSQRLDALVSTQQAALALAMQGQNASAESSQLGREVNNAANLQNTVSSLTMLLGQAKSSLADMYAYSASFANPAGISDAQAKQLNLNLGEFSCYAVNKNAVASQAAAMENKIQDLQNSIASAQSVLSSTQSHAANLNESSGAGGFLKDLNASAPPRTPASSGDTPIDEYFSSGISGKIDEPAK